MPGGEASVRHGNCVESRQRLGSAQLISDLRDVRHFRRGINMEGEALEADLRRQTKGLELCCISSFREK